MKNHSNYPLRKFFTKAEHDKIVKFTTVSSEDLLDPELARQNIRQLTEAKQLIHQRMKEKKDEMVPLEKSVLFTMKKLIIVITNEIKLHVKKIKQISK
jgi:hypothetical protein